MISNHLSNFDIKVNRLEEKLKLTLFSISECKFDNDCKSNELCHHVEGSGIKVCIDLHSVDDDAGLEIIQTYIH